MKKVIRLSESELEKIISKIIKETNESQVISDFKSLATMFDNLSKEFETIKRTNSNGKLEEQSEGADPCAGIKFTAGLYLQLVTRALATVAKVNPELVLAGDIQDRLRLATLQLEGLQLVAENLNKVKEQLK
jgi:hypothetical protein